MYKRLFLLFIVVVFISLSFTVDAAEGQSKDIQTVSPYTLNADGEISYDNKTGVLLAVDNARFEFEDVMVLADKVAVFYREDIVKAEGDQLVIKVGDEVYKGSSLEFNYQTKTGSISGVSSRINDLSFKGENITLTESNQFDIEGVQLTPCILPEPHYHIRAKTVKVYPEEKIVAKSVWLYFSGYPIFYLPSYTVKFDEETNSYEDVSFVPTIGYNTEDGIIATIDYPYEITDRLQGEMSGKASQHGDKYFEMNNTYKINSRLDLVNSYLYQDEEDDDGEIEQADEISGGLRYRNNGFNISSLYKWDFLNRRNIIEVDARYRYQKYNFRYFNKFIEKELSNEIYSIGYNNGIPLQLLYKKGYDIEYLPYLRIGAVKHQYYGLNINSTIGLGKVANKDIVSNKVRLDLNVNKSFPITNRFGINLYSKLQGNYYLPGDSVNLIENYYNYHLAGISGKMSSNINENIGIDYSLAYNYTWETGEAYLPEDKEDVEETLNPAVNITYRLSDEYKSSWKLGVQGSYELNNRDFEELNVILRRQFDCYSYYLGYDVIDEEFEMGINF